MLLAATVGEDDVKLFRFHVKEDKKWLGHIYEIKVAPVINFKWSCGNLDCGRKAGYDAASEVLKDYKPYPKTHTSGKELATAPH
jgi:hypothetical protein